MSQDLPKAQGWLSKQGGVRKNWKQRFFLLEGKKLKYFKQTKDVPQKPIDVISLEVLRPPPSQLYFFIFHLPWKISAKHEWIDF